MFLLDKISPNFDDNLYSGNWFPSVSVGLLNATAFIIQAYILCSWSAIVAFFTSFGAQGLVTGHPWLYYITGFIFFNAPLSYMKFRDPGGTGTFLHSIIANVAFISFALYPAVALNIYGWLIRIVY